MDEPLNQGEPFSRQIVSPVAFEFIFRQFSETGFVLVCNTHRTVSLGAAALELNGALQIAHGNNLHDTGSFPVAILYPKQSRDQGRVFCFLNMLHLLCPVYAGEMTIKIYNQSGNSIKQE